MSLDFNFYVGFSIYFPKKWNPVFFGLNVAFCFYIVFEFDEKNWKKKHDIDELYKAIRLYANIENKKYSYDVQHPNLKPTLRPYQAQAVQWMLNREHNALCIDGELQILFFRKHDRQK